MKRAHSVSRPSFPCYSSSAVRSTQGTETEKSPMLSHQDLGAMPIPPIDNPHGSYPDHRVVTDFLSEGKIPSDHAGMTIVTGWCLQHKQFNALTWLAIKDEITCFHGLYQQKLQHLAEWLASSPPVTALDLQDNDSDDAGAPVLDAAGAKVLASALEVNTTLTSLNLAGNRIGTAGDNKIGNAGVTTLAYGVKENRTLTALNLRAIAQRRANTAARDLIAISLNYNKVKPLQPQASVYIDLCLRDFAATNRICYVRDVSTMIVDQLSLISSDTVRLLADQFKLDGESTKL